MPGSASIYSVEIGARSDTTPGDIDPATGMPDVSGVTFYAFPCTPDVRGAMGGGAEMVNAEEHSRRSPGLTTPLVTAHFNNSGSAAFGAPSGEQHLVLTVESVALVARLLGWGAVDPAATPEGLMLASSFLLREPAQATVVASGAGADLGKIPVDDAGDIEVGDVLIRASGHFTEAVEVVAVATDPDILTVHPRLASAVADGDVFACCRVFYPGVGDIGEDVHLRFAMGGDGTDATVGRLMPMARLGSLGLTEGEGGAVQATWTMATKVALDTDSTATTVATDERKQPCIVTGTGTTIQIGPDHSALTAPVSAAVSAVDIGRFTWEWAIAVTIGDGAHGGRNVCRTDNRVITNATARLTLSVGEDGDAALFKRMLTTGQQRQIVHTMGPGWVPGGAGALGVPKGCALIARMARDTGEAPLAPGDGETIRRSVVLRAVNDGPNLGAATTPLANACWRLAIPMAAE